MITPELQDRILKYLIDNAQWMHTELNIHESARELKINFQIIDLILEDFEQRKFVEYHPMIGGKAKINLRVKGFDYYLGGGHIGEIENTEQELKNLKTEIEQIQPLIGKTKFDSLMKSINILTKYFALRSGNNF